MFGSDDIDPEDMAPARVSRIARRRWLVAAGSLALVLVAVVALGLTGTLRAQERSAHVDRELRINDALDDARSALLAEMQAELAYLDTGAQASRSDYAAAARAFDAALVHAASIAPQDQRTKAELVKLSADHRADVVAVNGVLDAVEAQGAQVVASDAVTFGNASQTLVTDLENVDDSVQRDVTADAAALAAGERSAIRNTAVLVAVGLALLALCSFLFARSRRLIESTGRAAAQELRKTRDWFRSLIDHSADLTMVLRPDQGVIYASPASQALLGLAPQVLAATPRQDVMHPDDLAAFDAARQRCASGRPGSVVRIEHRARHQDGSWRWLESTFSNCVGDPAVGGIVLNSRDVTERKHAEDELSHSATHDDLTGLPNRALLIDRLAMSIARARPRWGTAVLFCDLDHFEVINDTLGHSVGDSILIMAAERLAAAVSPGDTLARLAGDEFAVCCEGVAGLDEVEALANRFAQALAEPFVLGPQEIFVTASIGIRFSDGASDTAEELLRDADAAMYRAKGAGRARSSIFDATLRQESEKRLQIESGLHRALERHQLRVHYQPTVAIHDGTIAGVEALVRWDHPDRGMVPPGDFIAVAEDTGLIIPIGAWVLERACDQLRAWHDSGVGPMRMSVNLSGRQLHSPDLVSMVGDVLERTGVDPAELCLEITESVLMDDVEAAVAALLQLKVLGVRLAIDDFGTGYSSLGYLRRFPVDVLKVDRCFVSNLGADAQDTAIVTSVLQLARALGLDTVAEGVETVEQRRHLENLGCGLAQGYLWSRPVAAEDLEPWLQPLRSRPETSGSRRPKAPYSVVVADDEDLHREIVRRVLTKSGRFEVCGEAADGQAAIDQVEVLKPDLLVLDLSMPRMGGLEALPSVLAASPHTRVVLLSGSIGRGLDRGAADGLSACVSKNVDPDELLSTLVEVMGAPRAGLQAVSCPSSGGSGI